MFADDTPALRVDTVNVQEPWLRPDTTLVKFDIDGNQPCAMPVELDDAFRRSRFRNINPKLHFGEGHDITIEGVRHAFCRFGVNSVRHQSLNPVQAMTASVFIKYPPEHFNRI